MNPDQIFSLFQFGLLVKLLFMVLGIFYVIFAIVVYRQITLMTQVLDSKISPTVKTLAVVQIGMAGILFLLAVVVG